MTITQEEFKTAAADGLIVYHSDLQFVAIAKPESHHVDYEVYNVMNDSGGELLFEHGDLGIGSATAKIEECTPYLHGFVKWDGCSNWHFDEQDNVMMHACTRQELLRFSEVMARCHDWTAELLEGIWIGSDKS